MKKLIFVIITVFLPVVGLLGQVGGAILVEPRVVIPVNTTLSDGTSKFSIGGGLELAAEISFSKVPWFYAGAAMDAGFLPLKSASASMQTLSLGIGPGVRFVPASRLVLKASAYAGSEILLLGNSSAAAWYAEPRMSMDFQVSPSVNLGLGGGYRLTFGSTGMVYQGLTASIHLVYNLGVSKSGAHLESAPGLLPVYPLYYTYYDTHPAGTITIRNLERDVIRNVKVSYYVPQYMDRPKPANQASVSLKSGEETTFPLYALFSNDIFEVTEGLIVAGEVLVDYSWLGKEFTYSLPVSVNVLNRNAMTWDDDRKAAAYVTANNPVIKSYSKNIAANIRGDERDVFDLNFRIGMGLFEALTLHGMGYVVDPASAYESLSESGNAIDYIQFPAETLAYQAGDCDDLSVLFNAMLEASGIATAFITAPGHIFTAFDLGISKDRAERIFIDTSDLIEYEDSVWIPVEVTLVEQGFLEAWRVGAREWREISDAGTEGFYPTREAWTVYKPVENPTGELVFLPNPDEVMDAYGSALDRLIYQNVTPLVKELQARINREGSSPPANNRIGVAYAKYGLLDEAEPWFKRSTSGGSYAPGEVNLGNVAYLRKDYQGAAVHYQRALEIDEENSRALLGLAKASFELEDYSSADKSMTLLAQVNSDMARHYSYLRTTADTTVLRASSAAAKEVYGWDD